MEISNPSPEELEETLRLAFGHMPPEERCQRLDGILEQFRLGSASPDGVFQAKSQGERIGALFSQKRSDGTVLLWAPTMADGVSPRPFFEPLERFCRRQNAPAAIALIDFRQKADRSALEEAGFEYLSDMLYLVLSAVDGPSGETETALQFLPMVGQNDFPRMIETVQATYHNTRDFPRLLRLLPVQKVLDGYRDAGPFSPDLWFFVRKDDRDIGALLLSDQPDRQIELTYMGLTEEARGFGYGREIVRFAARLARQRHREYLLTAVDERNAPALHSYLSQGFRAWDRKNVYARFFE